MLHGRALSSSSPFLPPFLPAPSQLLPPCLAQIVLRLFEAIKVNSRGPQLLHQKRTFPHFQFSNIIFALNLDFGLTVSTSDLQPLRVILPLCPFSDFSPQYWPLYPLTDLPIVNPSLWYKSPDVNANGFIDHPRVH